MVKDNTFRMILMTAVITAIATAFGTLIVQDVYTAAKGVVFGPVSMEFTSAHRFPLDDGKPPEYKTIYKLQVVNRSIPTPANASLVIADASRRISKVSTTEIARATLLDGTKLDDWNPGAKGPHRVTLEFKLPPPGVLYSLTVSVRGKRGDIPDSNLSIKLLHPRGIVELVAPKYKWEH